MTPDLSARLAKMGRHKKRVLSQLFQYPNVVAVGIGVKRKNGVATKELCFCFSVEKKLPLRKLAASEVIPPILELSDGTKVSTDVVETGPAAPTTDLAAYRPARPGAAIQNDSKGGIGSLGGVCLLNGGHVALTANHVLTDPGKPNQAPGARRVWQPTRSPGGSDIGSFGRIAPLRTDPNRLRAPVNRFDVGYVNGILAGSISSRVIDLGTANDRFYSVGAVVDPMPYWILTVDVVKRGIETYVSRGRITELDVSVTLNYGTAAAPAYGTIGQGNSVFKIEGLDSRFAQPGDSGSIVIYDDGGDPHPSTGIVFAGSDRPGTGATFACNLVQVMQYFGLSTVGLF
ncbi:MAG: hypothetical protein U0Q16_04150 [Bryobacteraceae bacterium]